MMEALIIVTLTALIALMILPLAQQSSRDAINISGRELNIAAAQRGEAAFRDLLQATSQPRVLQDAPPTMVGNAAGFVVNVSAPGRSVCADAGVETRVAMRIEPRGQGGALVCVGQDGRQATLLRWDRGQAAFSYSAGGGWSNTLTLRAGQSVHDIALVRFSLQAAAMPPLTWVAPSGWTQPSRVTPDAGAQQLTQ